MGNNLFRSNPGCRNPFESNQLLFYDKDSHRGCLTIDASVGFRPGFTEGGNAVFNLTCHPQIIGRPHRIQMLERLISYMLEHDAVWFARMREIAEYAKTTTDSTKGNVSPALSTSAGDDL